jgi:hypothetical protein
LIKFQKAGKETEKLKKNLPEISAKFSVEIRRIFFYFKSAWTRILCWSKYDPYNINILLKIDSGCWRILRKFKIWTLHPHRYYKIRSKNHPVPEFPARKVYSRDLMVRSFYVCYFFTIVYAWFYIYETLFSPF